MYLLKVFLSVFLLSNISFSETQLPDRVDLETLDLSGTWKIKYLIPGASKNKETIVFEQRLETTPKAYIPAKFIYTTNGALFEKSVTSIYLVKGYKSDDIYLVTFGIFYGSYKRHAYKMQSFDSSRKLILQDRHGQDAFKLTRVKAEKYPISAAPVPFHFDDIRLEGTWKVTMRDPDKKIDEKSLITFERDYENETLYDYRCSGRLFNYDTQKACIKPTTRRGFCLVIKSKPQLETHNRVVTHASYRIVDVSQSGDQITLQYDGGKTYIFLDRLLSRL